MKMMKMSRLTLAATVVTVMIGAPRPAAAGEAPWCAESYLAWGGTVRECAYPTLEACLPYVTGGNRGFCVRNPAYRGPAPASRAKSRARRR
jgi:hypothetical protein